MAGKEDSDNAAPQPSTIGWDDSDMKTAYANVVNISSTREEVTLLFGTNQTWRTDQSQLTVKLSDRIIISPFAAKRLALVLTQTVQRYEEAFGVIEVGPRAPAQQPSPDNDAAAQ